jgi:Ion channel
MTQASPGRRWLGGAQTTVPARRSPAGRYGLLLLALIASYLVAAFDDRPLGSNIQLSLFMAVLLLALRTSRLSRRHSVLVGTGAVAGTAAALGLALTGTETGLGVAQLWKGFVLLVTAVLIVRRVLARNMVTIQSIYGALSAYIIVGLMFAAFYAAIGYLGGGAFFADHQPADTQTYQYFSFTTLTTLGYGDFTAASNGGRAIAVMEALTGQIFLATLVARLVAAFRAPAEPPGE